MNGEVTDENRERLPGFEFCPSAPARAQQAVAKLHWDAFRQLDYDTGLPAPSPSPGPPTQEFERIVNTAVDKLP